MFLDTLFGQFVGGVIKEESQSWATVFFAQVAFQSVTEYRGFITYLITFITLDEEVYLTKSDVVTLFASSDEFCFEMQCLKLQAVNSQQPKEHCIESFFSGALWAVKADTTSINTK